MFTPYLLTTADKGCFYDYKDNAFFRDWQLYY